MHRHMFGVFCGCFLDVFYQSSLKVIRYRGSGYQGKFTATRRDSVNHIKVEWKKHRHSFKNSCNFMDILALFKPRKIQNCSQLCLPHK